MKNHLLCYSPPSDMIRAGTAAPVHAAWRSEQAAGPATTKAITQAHETATAAIGTPELLSGLAQPQSARAPAPPIFTTWRRPDRGRRTDARPVNQLVEHMAHRG